MLLEYQDPDVHGSVPLDTGFPGIDRFCSAAVLAGGASRRMGGVDKQFIPIGTHTLTETILQRLRTEFSDLIIVTHRPECYARSPTWPVRALRDLLPGHGPLSGLHAALSTATSPWVYLAACDCPGFSPEWVCFLRKKVWESERRGEAPTACVAGYLDHIEPFHALYSKALLPVIEKLLKDREPYGRAPSLADLLKDLPYIRIPEEEARAFSEDWSLFFNVNRPSDLELFLSREAGIRDDRSANTRTYNDAVSSECPGP